MVFLEPPEICIIKFEEVSGWHARAMRVTAILPFPDSKQAQRYIISSTDVTLTLFDATFAAFDASPRAICSLVSGVPLLPGLRYDIYPSPTNVCYTQLCMRGNSAAGRSDTTLP